jgi:hypothetical protein
MRLDVPTKETSRTRESTQPSHWESAEKTRLIANHKILPLSLTLLEIVRSKGSEFLKIFENSSHGKVSGNESDPNKRNTDVSRAKSKTNKVELCLGIRVQNNGDDSAY